MTRKGSDVRGATIAKAAPQVIVGCGYLTDVIISLVTGSAGKRPPPVRLRKEGSRNQLLKWQSITYLRICVMLTNEIRMRQSAIRVQAHREVKPNSSPSTWDVPRPVRLDSDVRKRVITVEANKLEKRNPIQADGIEG